MQCGGRIWASATIIIIVCPVMHWNAIIVALHIITPWTPVRARIQPTPCDLTFVIVTAVRCTSMSRILTGDDD